MQNRREQGDDNGANMRGEKSDVQKRILEMNHVLIFYLMGVIAGISSQEMQRRLVSKQNLFLDCYKGYTLCLPAQIRGGLF